MSNAQFPKILAAAEKLNDGPWELGVAILEETGPPGEHGVHTGTRGTLEEAQAELASRGHGYALNYLLRLRKITARFCEDRRRPSVSFSICEAARTPEILGQLQARAHKENVPLTQAVARRWVDEMKGSKQPLAKPILTKEEKKELDDISIATKHFKQCMGDIQRMLTKAYFKERLLNENRKQLTSFSEWLVEFLTPAKLITKEEK